MKNLKLIGAVGGAISLALCWPLAVGQIGQNVITDGVSNMGSNEVAAELISYDRGYLSSHVQTRYTVINPVLKQQLQAEGFPVEVTVDSDISHGLVGISAVSTLADFPDAPIVINSDTQLNGTTSFTTSLQNWHYETQGPNGVAISVLSSEVKGRITALGEASYEVLVPSVAMNFLTGEQLLLSNLSGKGQGIYDSGFWVGKQNVRFDSLSADDGSDYVFFNLTNASYDFESQLDSATSRYTSDHQLNIETFYSDGGEVSDLRVDFTLGDVDSASFLAISDIYQSNPNLQADEFQQAMPYIDTLFAQGFSISLNPLALKYGEGEFSSRLLINVPQGTNNVAKDPSVILPALTGNLEAFVSNQLVEELPSVKQGIDELMVMEMVTQQADGYQFKAEIKQGNLVFSNGNQVPLFALLMSAVMSRGY